MGKELYENYPRFKLWLDYCDDTVQPLTKTSLIDVLYRQGSRSNAFDRILYSNPALLCIEYSLARVLMEIGLQPNYLLGYSLGEITACVLSGAISLEDGIRLTVECAKLLEAESPPAGMLAVIESPDIMTRYPEAFSNCWLSGKNFRNNFVVSGLAGDIQRLQEILHRENIVTQRLPVNYGFHTRLMDPLENAFKRLVDRTSFSPFSIQTFSSLKGGLIEEADAEYFWELVRHPIAFDKTINRILQKGDFIFIDVGPSGTLATFVKYLLPPDSGSLHLETINPFGRDMESIEKLKTHLSHHMVAAMA